MNWDSQVFWFSILFIINFYSKCKTQAEPPPLQLQLFSPTKITMSQLPRWIFLKPITTKTYYFNNKSIRLTRKWKTTLPIISWKLRLSTLAQPSQTTWTFLSQHSARRKKPNFSLLLLQWCWETEATFYFDLNENYLLNCVKNIHYNHKNMDN